MLSSIPDCFGADEQQAALGGGPVGSGKTAWKACRSPRDRWSLPDQRHLHPEDAVPNPRWCSNPSGFVVWRRAAVPTAIHRLLITGCGG